MWQLKNNELILVKLGTHIARDTGLTWSTFRCNRSRSQRQENRFLDNLRHAFLTTFLSCNTLMVKYEKNRPFVCSVICHIFMFLCIGWQITLKKWFNTWNGYVIRWLTLSRHRCRWIVMSVHAPVPSSNRTWAWVCVMRTKGSEEMPYNLACWYTDDLPSHYRIIVHLYVRAAIWVGFVVIMVVVE